MDLTPLGKWKILKFPERRGYWLMKLSRVIIMLKVTTSNKITTRIQRPLFSYYFPLTTLFGTWALIIFKILLLLVITRRYAVRRQRSNVKTLLLHRCCLRKFHWWQSKHGWADFKLPLLHSIHSEWKSKWMLATYRRRICINSLETRIVGSSCCP